MAQTTVNNSIVDNLTPVTPTMFQFTKYTDLPVSEYTGIPNISIPLYEFTEDGVKIPLNLTYHAGGIRVNSEASWVGLGWDMSIGSIVQQISDQDDYTATTHVQPDYFNTGAPYLFPFKYEWQLASGAGDNICNYGCNGPIEVNTPIMADGIVIYTSQYAPYNGDYGGQTGIDYKNFFDSHEGFGVDSEPDIFTANFLGHSFKFIRDPNTGQIVVLNKQGYRVTRSGQTWQVLVPSGEEYDFTLEDVVKAQTSTTAVTGAQFTSNWLPSTNIWMLTQIITKNKKVITFNYSQTAYQSCYPSVTQKSAIDTLTSIISTNNDAEWAAFCSSSDVTNGTPGLAVFDNLVFSQEQYTYLSSITFPQGTINFNLSARNDIKGGLKLDSLSVSTSQQIKSYKFNYSYFDATTVGGNTYNFGTGWGTNPLYRLKLLSIQDNSGAIHTFTYNSTPLPAKNSFATDYWGYYNGDTTNATLVPNAAQFNKTGWRTNSDNHSANVTYAQAGILQQIQYPTGGTVNFTYALNQFNNYWVPDYSSNTNTISSGDGLRIQAITWDDANNNQLKKTTYSYSTGLASLPLNFFRTYGYATTTPGLSGGGFANLQRDYVVNETNMSGIYTANPFASFNGVGYSQVIKTDVDINNNTNGKTVSNYYNNPDLVYNSITQAQQGAPTLPAYKDPNDPAENGSLKNELYYDNNNNLLKKVSNTYSKVMSPTYYGARVMPYASLVRYTAVTYQQTLLPQTMVGYYPIYDFETLLSGTTETSYFGADSVSVATTNSYDTYSQLASTVKTNSTYNQTTSYTYPYNSGSSSILTAMVTQNRLADVINMTQGTPNSAQFFTRTFNQSGNIFVPANDNIVNHGTSGIANPTVITYDQYDPTNGNIFQFTKNSLTSSVIYDYNKEYVIAEVKNAPYTSIAYTSFEADGTGRWKYSGTPIVDNNAMTGKKDYSLANGSIYRDSLNTAQTYIVSYWSASGPQTVNGNSTPIQGYTYVIENGETVTNWTYYEHTIANPASGTITVSGTGTIDELRLYPSNAQMTSYTYTPLVGISSVSDVGAKITYYEYDSFQRLMNIKDQSGNIVKNYQYHYQGQ